MQGEKMKTINCSQCQKEMAVNNHCNRKICDDCKKKTKICRSCRKTKDSSEFGKACSHCNKCKDKQAKKRSGLKNCKRCNKEMQVNKHATKILCEECKIEMWRIVRTKKCPCGKETIKYKYCDDCRKIKLEIKNQNFRKTHCKICKKELIVITTCKWLYCYNCKQEVYKKRKEKHRKIPPFIRYCIGCNKKITVERRTQTTIYCQECKKERQKIKDMVANEYINREIYRFCCKCDRKIIVDNNDLPRNFICEYCKENPQDLKIFNKTCIYCGKSFKSYNKLSSFLHCGECDKSEYYKFEKNGEFYKKCLHCKKIFKLQPKSLNKICEECRINSKFQKDNSRMCYGYQGYSSDGHKFASLNEQDLEEWLIKNKIKHLPHPYIGKTLRRADQYLSAKNIYVEIDGLNRNTNLQWLGKLKLYEELGLKYLIIKPSKIHYIKDKEKCFEYFDEKLKFLLDY